MNAPSSGPLRGTIVSYKWGAPGVIALDDGREVSFEPKVCHELVSLTRGTAVVVEDMRSVEGALVATRVSPFVDEEVHERAWPELGSAEGLERRYGADPRSNIVRVRRTLFDRDAVLRASPRWTPMSAEHAITAAEPALWKDIPFVAPDPFFEPWHASLCEAAAPCIKLFDAEPGEPVVGFLGGDGASPTCGACGGATVRLLALEPAAFHGLLAQPKRLSVHACPQCAPGSSTQLGEPGAPVHVEWTSGPARTTGIALAAHRDHSFTPSWLFAPRKDVQGHVPLEGLPSTLFSVMLWKQAMPDAPFFHENAGFAFDMHYRASDPCITLGGYAEDAFALCRTCAHPSRPLVRVDTEWDDDRFPGSKSFTLLSCDRTAACGGPERGTVLFSG